MSGYDRPVYDHQLKCGELIAHLAPLTQTTLKFGIVYCHIGNDLWRVFWNDGTRGGVTLQDMKQRFYRRWER